MNAFLVAVSTLLGPQVAVYPVADAPAVARFLNSSVLPVGTVVAVPVGNSRVLVVASRNTAGSIDKIIDWLDNGPALAEAAEQLPVR